MAPVEAFRAAHELVGEIEAYLSRYGARIASHNPRISAYFEMVTYHYIGEYYLNRGWAVEPRDLYTDDRGRELFKHKCGPMGFPENFSYMEATRSDARREHRVELRQNVRIASAYSQQVLYTPDVAVIEPESIERTRRPEYYQGHRLLRFVRNQGLITFAEAKHMVPFPELCATFIGMLHELRPECLADARTRGVHIAPSLLVSGVANALVDSMREELLARYRGVNVFFNVFGAANRVYGARMGVRSIGYPPR